MTSRAGAEQERAAVKDKTSTLFNMSMNELGTRKAADQQANDAMWGGIGSALSPF